MSFDLRNSIMYTPIHEQYKFNIVHIIVLKNLCKISIYTAPVAAYLTPNVYLKSDKNFRDNPETRCKLLTLIAQLLQQCNNTNKQRNAKKSTTVNSVSINIYGGFFN